MSGIKVIQGPADPVCSRVSLGGNEDVGYYAVYRGDLDACVVATEHALEAMKRLQQVPPPARPKVDPKFKVIGDHFRPSSS